MTSRKERLKAATDAVRVTDYLDYRDYLQRLYVALKDNLGRFSYVQLSEDLGLSRTNVAYLIIHGKRPLTPKAAKKVVLALGLADVQKLFFEGLVAFHNARTATDRDREFQKLMQLKTATLGGVASKRQLEFFTEWYHAAIFELAGLPGFDADPEALSARLSHRAPPDKVRKSLELLVDLELLRRADDGRLVPTQARVTTPPEVESMAMLRYHQAMLALAHQSLTSVHEAARDVTGVTAAIPAHAIPAFKQELTLFRERILALADSMHDKADTVYQFNLQMFPLTRSGK